MIKKSKLIKHKSSVTKKKKLALKKLFEFNRAEMQPKVMAGEATCI